MEKWGNRDDMNRYTIIQNIANKDNINEIIKMYSDLANSNDSSGYWRSGPKYFNLLM